MKKVLHISLLLMLFLAGTGSVAFGQTYTAVATGNWNSGTTWDLGTVPTAGSTVIISNNYTVTVATTPAAAPASVTINAPTKNNQNSQLVVNTGVVLSVGAGGVTVNGSVVTTRLSTLTVAGTLTVTGGVILDNRASVTFNLTNGTLNIGGTFTKGASATFTSTGSTVNFNGTTAQTLDVTNIIFNNVASNNTSAAGLTPNAAISATNVTGNLSIQTGTFNNGGFDIVGSGGATFSVSNGATFILSGTSSAFPSGYGSFTLGPSSTVNYAGTAAQTIVAQNYGNLTSSNLGVRTLASTGTIGIAGTFTPGGNTYTITGSTVDFNGTAPQTIPVFNYNNLTSSNSGGRTLASGTVGVAGAFAPGGNSYTITGNTIDLNGSGAQNVPAFAYNNLTVSSARGGATVTFAAGTVGIANTLSLTASAVTYSLTGNTVDFNGAAQSVPTLSYNNLTLSGSGTKTLPGALTLTGTLSLAGTASTTSTGSLTIGGSVVLGSGTAFAASTFTHSVAGNWTNNGGTFTPSSGTISFNGASPQTIGGSAVSHTFNGLTLNNSSGLSINADVTVGGTLTFTSGNVTTAGNTLISTGTVSRTSGHVIGMFRKTYAVSETKTFEVGTASSYTPAAFTINGLSVGGTLTISAVSGDHPNIGLSGLDNTKSVNVYWTAVNTGMTFSSYDVTFSYTAGDNDGGTVPANYDLGKYVSASWLTYDPTGTPTTTSFTRTGILAADGFGDYQIAQPVPGATYYWDGGGDGTSWGDAQNWFPDGPPSTIDNVILDNTYVGGSYTVSLGAARTVNALSLLTSNVTLLIGTGTALTVTGTFDQQAGTLETQASFPTAAVVSLTGGTVYYSASGAQSVFSTTYIHLTLGGSGAKTFPGPLTINGDLTLSGTASTASQGDLAVSGSVILGSGTTFDASTHTHTVGGDWTNNGGTVTPSTSTITFNGSSAQAINGTASSHTFSGLIVNKAAGTLSVGGSAGSVSIGAGLTMTAGTYALTVPTTVSGTTTLNGGTVSVGTTTFNINGSTSVSAGSLTSDPTGTVSYGGTAQDIVSATYGNLTLAGSGTKTLPGALTIGGSFTLSGTASTTAAGALTVNGSVILGSGTAFDASTFSHSIGGDWTNNGGSFTPSSSTVSFTGSSAQSINGAATSETFAALTLNNASGLTLSSDVTVGGTLTFTSGNITAAADTLTANGTVIPTGGHIVGYLKKPVVAGNQSLSFEIGDAGAYTPVTIGIAGSSGAGTLTASTLGSDHPQVATSGVNPAKSANRYWTVVGTGFSVTSADVTVNFVAGDVDAGADPTLFVIDQYDGTNWLLPTTGTVTTTSTQATGLAWFGAFQVGQSSAGLITSTAAGGNWSAPGTWVGGVVPTNNAEVVIATTGGDSVTIDVSTATLTNITISSGAKLSGSAGTSLIIKGSIAGTDLVNDGTFNGNGGTVLLNGSQEWSGTGSFNLSFIDLNNKALTLSFASANTISVDGATTPIITPGSLVPNANTALAFSGTADQTINVSGLTYHHLYVNNSAIATLNAAVTTTNVTGDLRILGGTLNNGTFASDGNGGATFEVANGATFELAGTSAFPTTFTPSLGGTSTVDYGGTSQTVAAVNYGHLTLTTGTKTLASSGTVGVAGALSLISAPTVVTTSSTVDYNGTGTQTITSGVSYNNLTISGTADTSTHKTPDAALTVGGTLTIAANATLDMAGFSGSSFGGGSVNNGKMMWSGSNVYVSGTGTTEFYSSAAGTVDPGAAYGNMWFTGSGVKTISGIVAAMGGAAGFGVTISNNLTVDLTGDLTITGMDLNVDGNLTNDGTISVQ